MGHSNRLGSSNFDAPLAQRAANTNEGSTKVSEDEAAKWAGILIHSLSLGHETHALGLQASEAPKTSGAAHVSLRHGLGTTSAPLDDGAVTQSQLADTHGVNEAVPNRLILNVDSETLGRVQLVVDRDEGGVRVLVGSDPESRSRLSEGKHAITEALSAAGVRVGALRFVTLNEVGTVLAQDLMSKKSRSESTKKDDTKEPDKNPKTKRHNLNLVG